MHVFSTAHCDIAAWLRTQEPLTIRAFEPADSAAVQALADSQLGLGYVELAHLGAHNCLVACTEDVLAGFVVVQCGLRVSSLKTIVVDPAWKGRTLAKRLAQEALSTFVAETAWTSPAWEHDGRVPADELLRSLGFAPVVRLADYWFDDSVRRGYSCPACGHPCHCAAVLYALPRF